VSDSESKLVRGKSAFVTGGSRGIGWEVARTLAAHGADVAINGRRDPHELERKAAELAEQFGVRTLAIAGDVSDPECVKGFYQTIFKAWSRLDILVNNAGVLEDALLGMITSDLIGRVIDVNTKGSIYNLQGAARLMARARSGSIINMTSIIGVRGNEGQVVYGASKAALIGLTCSAAKELAPQGIRVNAVAPGFIDTEMIRHLSPEMHARRLGQIGMGRIGTPQDVAKAVLFFASDLSAYVTGQVLGVDGGMRI
jgi:3-oxoacyl-[acyl-carrier protein] reductase